MASEKVIKAQSGAATDYMFIASARLLIKTGRFRSPERLVSCKSAAMRQTYH
jgi:hypothetical protein